MADTGNVWNKTPVFTWQIFLYFDRMVGFQFKCSLYADCSYHQAKSLRHREGRIQMLRLLFDDKNLY